MKQPAATWAAEPTPWQSPRQRPLADRVSGPLAVCLLALGLLLRLAPIAEDPLHPDECLYSSWALTIIDDGDVWLRSQAIDKPPLYPYLSALWMLAFGRGSVAVRSLGLASAAVTMGCLWQVARASFGPAPALAGLAMIALSPIAVALDASAFTDPPAIALALLACLAAARRQSLLTGVLLALAAVTKPQAIALAPLALAWRGQPAHWDWRRLMAGAGAVLGLTLAWEVVRAAPHSFVASAVSNYGLSGGALSATLAEWARLLRWVWGAPSAIVLWTATCSAAAVLAVVRRGSAASDRIAAGAAAALALYLGISIALRIPAWDRYALVAVAPAALLLSWGCWRLAAAIPSRARSIAPLALAALTVALMLPAAREAAESRLEIGDTGRWQGIEQVVAYLRGQVPGRATVLYHDFGWHLRYYAHGFPQDFRWWADLTTLAAEARRTGPTYVLLPADGAGAALAALAEAGVSTRAALVAYRPDGSRSMTLYRLTRNR